jgi:GNAT superfamily N-acetyltransferase
VPSKRKLGADSVSSVHKTGGKSVIPRHVRRALECVETILSNRSALPVGYIGEGRWSEGTWLPAEILNVSYTSQSELYYYVHYLGKDKKEDDWLSASTHFRTINDLLSIRDSLEDTLPLKQLSSSTPPSSPSCSTTEDTMDTPATQRLWSQFFSFSLLLKQTSSGGSAYSTAPSSGVDPHEFSPKTVRGIHLRSGPRVKAWYRSPYEEKFWSVSEYLRMCDLCLCYGESFESHECGTRSIDRIGTVVYEADGNSVFEIDGLAYTDFCIRLLLLSKLFLEDKRMAPDGDQAGQVTPFLFYVLTERSPSGEHSFVGYFSKYKVQKRDSPILSCIMVLPSAQRRGYGRFLISMAYALTRREGRQGSAERPLSGPGYGAFLGWWTNRLREVFSSCYDGEVISVAQISELSGMTSEDVVETLRACGSLKQWGNSNEVKLRESGKKAKIKLTMDLFRALGRPGNSSGLQFDHSRLSDKTRVCPVIPATPTP